MNFGNTDYVVGGGTAGSVLAARLSEDSTVRVVLVEAGTLTGPAEVARPDAWPRLLGGPIDWAFRAAPQSALCGRTLPYPRGKVLGGTSAINGMMHLRAHRGHHDAWGGGIGGWSYGDLLPYFRRSETAPGRDANYRYRRPDGGGRAGTKERVRTVGPGGDQRTRSSGVAGSQRRASRGDRPDGPEHRRRPAADGERRLRRPDPFGAHQPDHRRRGDSQQAALQRNDMHGVEIIDAVVDAELRVRGVSGLRVADASVMPDLVGANPNATILAIAERAADLVKASV